MCLVPTRRRWTSPWTIAASPRTSAGHSRRHVQHDRPRRGDTHTYTLVSGAGDTDNASFTIDGSTPQDRRRLRLRDQVVLLHPRPQHRRRAGYREELHHQRHRRQRGADRHRAEQQQRGREPAVGTTVGTFSTTDPDAATPSPTRWSAARATPTTPRSTIAGEHPEDQRRLRLRGQVDLLHPRRSTDDGRPASSRRPSPSASPTSTRRPPTDIALDNTSVAEDQPVGTSRRHVQHDRPRRGDTYTYRLVGGAGDTDNASFTIERRHPQDQRRLRLRDQDVATRSASAAPTRAGCPSRRRSPSASPTSTTRSTTRRRLRQPPAGSA